MCELAAAAKLLQSCLTLCDPRDGSPPGSPVPGILQERTLEWVAIAFSNAWKWKVKVKSLSRVRLLVTPWTAAYQAPPSMGFSRQEYWSGVPLPSPREWWDNIKGTIFKKSLFYIGVWLINNVVLFPGVQVEKSDSVLYTHISILFKILFPFRLLKSTEQTSLCYTVGPCWLFISNIAVCPCLSQTCNLSLQLPLPHKLTISSFFQVCETASVLYISSFVLFVF